MGEKTGRVTFSREDIYKIRYHARELGWSAVEIWRTFFGQASPESIRRIIRGETHRSIGVGRSELPMHGNRLEKGPNGPEKSYEQFREEQLAGIDADLMERMANSPTSPEEEARIAASLAKLQANLREAEVPAKREERPGDELNRIKAILTGQVAPAEEAEPATNGDAGYPED